MSIQLVNCGVAVSLFAVLSSGGFAEGMTQ